jgi:hypothetical protein
MAHHDKKKNKQNLPIARVTTHLKGITKKRFFDELELKQITESQLANEIITKHYL